MLQTREKKRVLMASLDVRRPAAMEQLKILGEQAGVATLPIVANQMPLDIARRALASAKVGGYDVLILDTAGRQHIDEALMAEVAASARRREAARNAAGRRQPDRPGRGQHREILQRAREAFRHHPDPRRWRCARRRGAFDAHGHRRADQIPRRGRKARRAGSLPSRARRRAASSTWAMWSAWSKRPPRRSTRNKAEKLAAQDEEGRVRHERSRRTTAPDEKAGRHEGRARRCCRAWAR